MAARIPDFFIVGAPKCGTTAMYHYLRQHPQVFMPDRKEPHYFSLDVRVPGAIRNPADYHALFEPAGAHAVVGEASVSYLGSRAAAHGIHAARPDARIVVMLRDPGDARESFHAQMVYECLAEHDDLDRAMAIQAEARELILAHKGVPYVYEELLRFDEQVARYESLFGAGQVHVIRYGDLSSDPGRVYEDCSRFLGLDAVFEPRFEVINARKRARSASLQRLLKRPPPVLARLRGQLPPRVRSVVAETLLRLNTTRA